MLLDFFYSQASKNGLRIHITTTADADMKTYVRDQFRQIRNRYQNDKPGYDIKDTTTRLPHYRRIKIKSKQGEYSLWLDKGVHIYWFEDLTRYRTVDSYIVVEKEA